MVVFNSDLDNTLIYSYKQKIGNDKKCVEIYQDREASFMTDYSYGALKRIKERMIFVPTTTRTMEQYSRIDLGIGIPHYALVCNGGILLVDGLKDEVWYETSQKMISDCVSQLKLAVSILEKDENRCFEIRDVDGLFLFTKSSEPKKTCERLTSFLDLNKVDILYGYMKVYVVPKKISKGHAVERLKEKIGASMVIAAGDSEFDVSMLNAADAAFAPEELQAAALDKHVNVIKQNDIFSDVLLEYIETNF